MHYSADCKFRDHVCRDCKKKGHKEGYCACFARKGNKKPPSKGVKVVSVKNVSQTRMFAEIEFNQVPVQLQIDLASDITVISDRCWKQIGIPSGVKHRAAWKRPLGHPLTSHWNSGVTWRSAES
ncbi:conserved hypothetical protein [Culex quinquefasciatus]|uniref:Uncharacterized protein n=1 Tax=Culex quinquefasciatus TaxID=7176 RepID=B0XAA6_CULQU|nr:conserved hypothetical protein [Culex quinquefasciatus]|eukprot:XP_001866578.1 conserved hypothetical protein [Culex quinquefasciatus]